MNIAANTAPAGRQLLAAALRPRPRWSRLIGPTRSDEPIEVSVLVRPRAPLGDTAALSGSHFTREAFVARYGALQDELEAVAAFATSSGLDVISSDAGTRLVVIRGPASRISAAFSIALNDFAGPRGVHRGHDAAPSLPIDLAPLVEGVFGLDNRRQARPHVVFAPASTQAEQRQAEVRPRGVPRSSTVRSFTPPELGELYAFPAGTDGAGQTIGIVEFGGGYLDEDLDAYFQSLRLPRPTVTAVGVAGGRNQPTPADGTGDTPDGEVMLDLEVAGALAPAAKLVTYFAPFDERGWVDALRTAIHDRVHRPTVLSISWGWTEDFGLWSAQALRAVNDALREAAALGVTVLCASGDDGSADEQPDGLRHVDFPASSPWVTAVGGSSLRRWATTGAEAVWNDGPRALGGGASGGGISRVFCKPSYQSDLAIPAARGAMFAGRGVPDVCANADPSTGYRVRVRGQDRVAGGTSAAAPLWAALVARLNQKLGRCLGFLNPRLYAHGGASAAMRDIVWGTNDTTGLLGAFPALRGWDAATGWGSPDGTLLARALEVDLAATADRLPPVHASSWTERPEDVAQPEANPTTQPWPGYLQAVAVAGDDTVWAISGLRASGGFRVHRWAGGHWQDAEHTAVRLAAGPSHEVATVNAFGVISVRDSGNGWITLPGLATDIAWDPDGVLWAVGSLATAHCNQLGQWVDGKWAVDDTAAVRVALLKTDQPAVVRPGGQASVRVDGRWLPLPGLHADVFGGAGGTLYAVGLDGLLRAWDVDHLGVGSARLVYRWPVADFATNGRVKLIVRRDARMLELTPGSNEREEHHGAGIV
jgi:kumamolisin